MRSIYANVRAGCAALALVCASAASAQMLVIGDDNKTNWNDAGKAQFGAPGKDEVVLVDIASPDAPRIAATLPLSNSIAGPRPISRSHPTAGLRWSRTRWRIRKTARTGSQRRTRSSTS